MESSKQRIEWIDTARGMLTILMVLGHYRINISFAMIINSFHMAAFFMLSGFTLKVSERIGLFLWKKFKRLIVPYFVFAVIMLAYQFAKTFIFSDAVFDLRSGLISVFIPIGGRESTTTYGLWFLPCLFCAEIISYIVIIIWNKVKAMGVIAFGGFIVLGEVIYQLSSRVSIIAILPIAVTFIILGYTFKEMSNFIEKKPIWLPFSWVMFMVSVFANWMYCKGVLGIDVVDLSHMRLGFWPLFILSSFFGSLAICGLAMMIKNTRLLATLGQDSLYYYGLHYEIIGAVGKFFPGTILQTAVTFAILYVAICLYRKAKALF